MNKLSKEQAEWLLERFNSANSGIAELSPLDIKSIINQCTENEFPKIRMEADGSRFIYFEFKDDDDRIVLNDDIWFDFKQFKAFTQGCIKICDWLQEQE